MTAIDPARYRHVLGAAPTSVVVITASAADGPLGLVIGSFTSVSLDPPLVGFLPSRASTTWPRIEPVGKFAVNILAADQRHIVEAFMTGDMFTAVDWAGGPVTGAPLIHGALASIECAVERVDAAGDHHWVLGRVHAVHDHRPNAAPLVFHASTYHTTTRLP